MVFIAFACISQLPWQKGDWETLVKGMDVGISCQSLPQRGKKTVLKLSVVLFDPFAGKKLFFELMEKINEHFTFLKRKAKLHTVKE